MNKGRAWLEVVHTVTLSLWLGAVVMSGVAAAIVFPTAKSLEARSGLFEKYDGEHWRLVAGQIANRIFLASDTIQLVCASAGLLTLGLRLADRANRPRLAGVRVLLFSIASAVLGYHLFILAPRMHGNLREFYVRAMAGENDAAEVARQAFGADHPTASKVLGAMAVSLFVLLCVTVWSLAMGPSAGAVAARARAAGGGLEEPALLRKGR